jgi:hypothetical protein
MTKTEQKQVQLTIGETPPPFLLETKLDVNAIDAHAPKGYQDKFSRILNFKIFSEFLGQ